MTGERSGSFYVVCLPGKYPYELRVVKSTGKRPRVTPEGSVVVKLTLKIPRAAFEPLKPEAVVTVPDELVQHPVEVEAEDAND